MPIYEFVCLTCRHVFDVFGGYESRNALQICPQCEGTSTRALFSKVVALRGSSDTPSSDSPSPAAGSCACGGACSCAN